jgi:16S rRNA processing protein RimM
LKSSSSKVDVGYVARAHGIKGALRIRTSTDLSSLTHLELGERSFRVLNAQRDKDDWLVTIEGVIDRNAAEALRGTPVRVDRDAITVADDELLVSDLVGCRVVDAAGQLLGEVTGSFDSGAHEILEVKRANGKELLLPFIDAFITNVDLEARTIACDPPPGLVDLDEVES